MNESLIPYLKTRLQQPLPGRDAQWEMSSRGPARDWQPREDHRKGGVLALMYPHQEVLHMVFMKRTDDGKVHGGQVSFAGGKMEQSDRNVQMTALREAEEELGIPQTEVEILGQLSPLYIAPSNFLVYPQVGFLPYRPEFVPSPMEVAAIIETELPLLLAPETRQTVKVKVGQNMTIKTPAFLVNGQIIWGATAMMLNELLTVIRGRPGV
ncbi:MAG: CoA pyrophosphatase [Bacteroidota bacterium]